MVSTRLDACKSPLHFPSLAPSHFYLLTPDTTCFLWITLTSCIIYSAILVSPFPKTSQHALFPEPRCSAASNPGLYSGNQGRHHATACKEYAHFHQVASCPDCYPDKVTPRLAFQETQAARTRKLRQRQDRNPN